MLVSVSRPLNRRPFKNYLLQNLKNPPTTHSHKYLGSESSGYAGLGKTTVRIINNDDSHLNVVNTYSTNGFRLSNNLFITGPIILFPTHVFSWSIKRGRDISPESLRIFDLIVPKVKIVVIGYGYEDEPYDSSLPYHLKKRGISCELLPTPRALTTYNFLLSDAIHVAGAFVTYNRPVVATSQDHERLHIMPDILNDLSTRQSFEPTDTKKYYEPMYKKLMEGSEEDSSKR